MIHEMTVRGISNAIETSALKVVLLNGIQVPLSFSHHAIASAQCAVPGIRTENARASRFSPKSLLSLSSRIEVHSTEFQRETCVEII